MKNGYRIAWTDHALSELQEIVDHLLTYWTEKELRNFSRQLNHTIELIAKNPDLFPKSKEKSGVRRAVVGRLTILYYRKEDESVQILSLFSTRQNPDRIVI